MFEDRSLFRDLLALVLLALGVFLTLSLATYDRGDPPSLLVYPPGEAVANACGRTGALAAHYLLEGVGYGAYFLVVSLLVFDGLLLARRQIDQPIVRLTGWTMAVTGLATMLALALPNASPGPVIGPGGYLGAAGRALLEANFATAGSVLLTTSIIVAGLLLCTDYVLFRLGFSVARVSTRGVGRAAQMTGAVARRKTRRKSDVDDASEWEEDEYEEEDEGEDSEVLPIRFRGKSSDEEDEHEEEEVAEDEEEDKEPDEAPAAPKKSLRVKRRLTSALFSRKSAESEREEVIDKLEAASLDEEPIDYDLPPIELLLEGEDASMEAHEKEVRAKAKILEKTFASFGFKIKVVEIETGPVIAQYEVQLEAGLRLSKITGLADDLAIALRVPSVRIVAPIPGKNTVGIEVPNETRHLVRLREVIEETNGRAKRMKIPIYLGKDVAGNPMVSDLTTLPHLLIAGRTGTGKSVCLNSIIVSMLMTRRPDEVRMLMIDPKMVELSPYKRLPHLMHPVVTDMKKAEAILAWAVDKMEERYALLARAGVRHISSYNQLGEDELRDRFQPENEEEWVVVPKHLPFIVIVADELADLMLTCGKEVEQHIIRLAQKSRAVGIHLILATQKPTVDVITGLIKSNLPARIAFQVSSRTDSRVVLDEMGAEKLLGNGDMLFLLPGTSMLLRGQGTYLCDEEINRVVDAVATNEPQFVKELVQLKTKEEQEAGPGQLKHRDELYEGAVDVVVREGRGSVSLLQRALGIGYGRAARLIDFMAEDGIVGEYNGSQAREVLITIADWEAMTSGEATTVEQAPPPPRRSNRILPEPDTEVEDDADQSDEYEEENEEAEYEDEEEAEDDYEEEASDSEEVDEEELDEDEDEEDEYEEEEEDEEYEELAEEDDEIDAEDDPSEAAAAEEDEEDVSPALIRRRRGRGRAKRAGPAGAV